MPPTPVKRKRQKTFAQKYPVKEYVGEIPIRENNILSMYFPSHKMRAIALLVSQTGISAANILSISAQPCECCKDKPVIFEENGVRYEIPRGLLLVKKKSSGSILTQKKRKKE